MSSEESVPKTDAVHGVGKTSAEAELQHTKKTAPLPEGMSEMNDRNLSMGAVLDHNSGKGGSNVKGHDVKKGVGALPGTAADRIELGRGDAEIADRPNPELRKN